MLFNTHPDSHKPRAVLSECKKHSTLTGGAFVPRIISHFVSVVIFSNRPCICAWIEWMSGIFVLATILATDGWFNDSVRSRNINWIRLWRSTYCSVNLWWYRDTWKRHTKLVKNKRRDLNGAHTACTIPYTIGTSILHVMTSARPRARNIREDLLNFDMMCDSKISWRWWHRTPSTTLN